eukprot:5612485-Alexandrium_andersonii.AAC.1
MAAPTLLVERRLGPDLAQAVYLDDRTGFTATLGHLREALELWRRFEAASGLPTNAAKTPALGPVLGRPSGAPGRPGPEPACHRSPGSPRGPL